MNPIDKYFPGTITQLGDKQALFTACLGNLIEELYQHPEYDKIQVRFGDGSIQSTRKVIYSGGILKGVTDCVHMVGGCHYMGLAQDLNIFIDGVWQSKGTEDIWKFVKRIWTEQHPLCSSGLDFGDANHVSITHNGKR